MTNRRPATIDAYCRNLEGSRAGRDRSEIRPHFSGVRSLPQTPSLVLAELHPSTPRRTSDVPNKCHSRVTSTVWLLTSSAPLNPSNVRNRNLRLTKKAALPEIRFHDLRHTCATLLLGKNFHPKIVQEMTGHATVAITPNTYSHVLPDMGDQAAEAMEVALI